MEKYLLTLLNIIIALSIWIGPAVLFELPIIMTFSWVLSLIVYHELTEIIDGV